MRWWLILFLSIALPAQAAVEVLNFKNEQQQEDYKALINELRCLVCQNQNLADSNADLAKDLRQQTYDMIAAGKSKQEIADYMVARYGDFVLYRPPLSGKTVLLWLGPALFMLAGGIVMLTIVRRKSSGNAPDQSSLDRARALLNDSEERS